MSGLQRGGAAALNRVTSAAYAASITPNCDTTDILAITGTLTGALTLANPTGTPADGQRMRIRLTQDATGRVVTLGSAYALPTGDTIPSTPNIVIYLGLEYSAAVSKWRVVAIKVVS